MENTSKYRIGLLIYAVGAITTLSPIFLKDAIPSFVVTILVCGGMTIWSIGGILLMFSWNEEYDN